MQSQKKTNSITLITKNNCKKCDIIKEFLIKNNIRHKELNGEKIKDKLLVDDYPLLIIGNEIIINFKGFTRLQEKSLLIKKVKVANYKLLKNEIDWLIRESL